MNRNTNAHFSELPNVDIHRSTFDRSFSHKTSGLVGRVIPVFFDEILPGDTVVMDTSKVIRFQTMLTPVMDNIYCDFYWYFVPNRLVWEHWINLMGENTSGAWAPEVEYSVPQLVVPPHAGENDTPNNNKVGTLLDYLGFPVEFSDQTEEISINALPIRGYCKIIQDWFVDENIQDPINIYTGDADVTATTEESYINDLPHGGVPFVAAKFADYFTSCLPSAQKGDPVQININSGFSGDLLLKYFPNAEVPSSYTIDEFPKFSQYTPEDIQAQKFNLRTGTPLTQFYGASGNNNMYHRDAFDGTVSSTSQYFYVPNKFGVTVPNTGTASFDINDLRYAFQLQKLLERDARGGSRYIETIKAHFNVDSPDQRLQRSEYLGGNRFAINVNQVSNTAQSEQDFLGDLGAFSLTTDVHSDFTKSFTEHGMLFGLMVIRYDHTYSQGLRKFWKRKGRYDYYWPVFANIGEQPVDKSEIYLTGKGTFGFQEAYADLRYMPNMVSAELRPYVNNGLASWTLADDYSDVPSLSDEWIRESETNVDRVLSVTSNVSNQFWADIYFNYKHTRPMPVYSIPGLIDHN